jgi:hypothetical protein
MEGSDEPPRDVPARRSNDELTTATVTARLGRRLDAAYSTSQALMLSADPARRAELASTLYDRVVIRRWTPEWPMWHACMPTIRPPSWST